VWCARQGELTYAGARIVVAVSLALEAAVGVNLASARRAEEAAMFTVDGNVLETRSQARRGEEPVTVPRFEGEIDARDPIAIVEDHQCRGVAEQRDPAGFQPAAFLPAREQAEQLLADQLEFAAHTPVLTSRALPSLQPTIATCDCLVTIASSVRLVLKYTYKNLHVNLMPHLYG
jgi:hypothetical protein